jgi:hypothetical protein
MSLVDIQLPKKPAGTPTLPLPVVPEPIQLPLDSTQRRLQCLFHLRAPSSALS